MQKHYHDYWKDETPEWIDFMKTSPEKGQLLKVRVNGTELGYIFTWDSAFKIANEFTFPSRTVDDIEDYEDAALKNKISPYAVLGNDADTVDREKVFEVLSEITNLSYNDIFNMWLNCKHF